MAIDDINNNSSIKFELVIEDSPCNPNLALNALNKLITIDKVDALSGPICSSEMLAIAPKVNDYKKIIISTATSPEITNAGDYVFRDVPSDDLRAKFFARFIYQTENITKIAIIYENDDAGVAYEKAFVDEFNRLGGKIIIAEQYDKGSPDMRSQLTKISGADDILMISFPTETGMILKQSRELGIVARFFEGFEIMSDPQVAEIAGNATEGVIFIQAKTSVDKSGEEFRQRYLERFGAQPPFYSAEAYDSIMIYGALLKHRSDLDTLKERLYALKNFNGASGTISFDDNGDVTKPFEIGQIRNSKLETITIVS